MVAQRASNEASLSATCNECGGPCAKIFCSKECRQVWTNRRMQRGALLHDAALVWRRERKWHLLTKISRMVDRWVAEDKAAGRNHYLPPPTDLTGVLGRI